MLGRVVMHPEGRDLLPAALLAAAEHDVRGLLGTVRGGAETLRVHLDGSPLEEVAAAVGRAGEQLAVVLSELVTAANQLRDGALADDTVDVGGLLGELAGLLGIEDVVTQTDEPLLVVASRVAVRHVLLNLLDNAVAARGAGAVSVRVGSSGPDGFEVMIRNPLGVEPVGSTAAASLLHTERGRGIQIVEVLAAATGLEYAAEVVGGHYIARVQIPRRLWHPSLQQPETVAGHAGQVIVLREVVRAANAEQSG